MKKFKVTATMDVGYAAIIEANNQEEAWRLATSNLSSGEPDWEQTDNGHDWTVENIWEATDDDLRKIPPHEEFKVSQAANNDMRTDIDGITKEEMEAIDEKIRRWEDEFHPLTETQRGFMRMHEAHHIKAQKFHKFWELASVSPSANPEERVAKAVENTMEECEAISDIIALDWTSCEQGQMGAGKNKLIDQLLNERISESNREYIFDPKVDKIEFPEPVQIQKHKANPPRNPFASETQSIKGHKSRK